MKNTKIFLGLLIFTLNQSLHAELISFESAWKQISLNSPLKEAYDLQIQSTLQAQSRSNRHWLPKLYIDAKAFNTNDPGQEFFGILEQRKVDPMTDFGADSLNHPDVSSFSRAAVGIDWALYEGGMKMGLSDVYDYSSRSQKAMAAQANLDLYSQAATAYGSLAIIQRQAEKLESISIELSKLIKSYQIGQKSNPVGYSGLLGMKSLSNRITGLIEQYKAQKQAYEKSLKILGVKEDKIAVENLNSLKFIERYLNVKSSEAFSYKQQSAQAEAKAAQSMAEMEKARFLPRIGAFAENYLFSGKRDTANGYTAGLYLQWSIFDPSDFGKYKESQLKAQAAEKMSQALLQQENAEKAALEESEKALNTNLRLIQDSDLLMSEQMKMATTLFRNGSMSALQLVEILNRRTDLIIQQNEIEINLIKNASSKVLKSNFNENLSQGAQ